MDGYLCAVCQHCSNLEGRVDDNLLLAESIDEMFLIFEPHEYFMCETTSTRA